MAKIAYYTSVIEEKKKKKPTPRLPFSTVRLTKSHSSVEPCFPLTLNNDDFMSFFTNEIVSILEKIYGILPTAGIDQVQQL